MFEQRKSICEERQSTSARTQFAPFNLQTEARSANKPKEQACVIKENFKAREMPTYKFFEPKHEAHQPTKFVEFGLSTEERSRKKADKEEKPEV